MSGFPRTAWHFASYSISERAMVRLHVSREKDKEIALGRCRMGRYESFSRTAAGKLAGVEGWILPPGRGER